MNVYNFISRGFVPLVIGLILTVLTGCDIIHKNYYQPDNHIFPTSSFLQRLKHNDKLIQTFDKELNEMDGWAPPLDWFVLSKDKIMTLPNDAKKTACENRDKLKIEIDKIAAEYCLQDLPDNYYEEIFKKINDASFDFKIPKEYNNEEKKNAEKEVRFNFYTGKNIKQTCLKKDDECQGKDKFPLKCAEEKKDKCNDNEIITLECDNAQCQYIELLRTGRENLRRHATDMLIRIDYEHPKLLVDKYPVDTYECYTPIGNEYQSAKCELNKLPRMVSDIIPAGVSLTLIHEDKETKAEGTDTSKKEEAKAKDSDASKKEEKKTDNSSGCQITINNNCSPKPSEATTAKKENFILPYDDFKPEQDITLSLSTVLNSADIWDRLEYVSTFVYIYPYQKPQNGNLSLNDEFWRQFFWKQSGRIPKKVMKCGKSDSIHNTNKGSNQAITNKDNSLCHDVETKQDMNEKFKEAIDAIGMDLRYAFEAMGVHLRNIETKVILKDTIPVQMSREVTDNIGGNISVSLPLSAASINPGMTFSSQNKSSSSMSLLHQLDQRSAYIAPDANFFRITQRGMLNANLAGRFNEKVYLNIPKALETIKVIVPTEIKEGSDYGFTVKDISQPLYSRVDAIFASIAVVRHPAFLRKVIDENYALPLHDVADTDFIVGLPYPSRITLWTWERRIHWVTTNELLPNCSKGNLIYFRDTSCDTNNDDCIKPLYIAGFSDKLSAAFKREIFNKNKYKCECKCDSVNQYFKGVEISFCPTENQDIGCLSKPTNGSYYIRLKDKDTDTTIHLGLLGDDGKTLTSFSSEEYLKSIK